MAPFATAEVAAAQESDKGAWTHPTATGGARVRYPARGWSQASRHTPPRCRHQPRLRQTDDMPDPGLTDGVVLLRQWQGSDADWYADAARDPVIQCYTTELPTLTADQVRAAIANLADQAQAVGFVVCDATTSQRQGNIALYHNAGIGQVSYWVAASARGRGVATRALRLLSDWAFVTLKLSEIRLWTHKDNVASRLVAERAGYRHAPEHDQQRAVKGQVWNTVGYIRPTPGQTTRHPPATP